MSCFVFCVDFVTGPEPMEVDEWSCDEPMEWEPVDTVEPMEWEESFIPPQVSPCLQATPESGHVSDVSVSETNEPDNDRRKKKAMRRL
ncbi:hypothetical protein AVEN_28519-1 [Araneus ventricosus]|uniref:Uncharacterized protein n=1 Tax=Araneus ventricosus TaxID=182803 RepID=A0A4Y2VET0_ARAVE|nr:hypothetical protein AVEN_28519-1 [Araneus ventricosus]